jgi:hypothetical protein
MNDAVGGSDDGRPPGRHDVERAVLPEQATAVRERIRHLGKIHSLDGKEKTFARRRALGAEREDEERTGVEEEKETNDERTESLVGLPFAAVPHTPPPRMLELMVQE